MRTRAVTAASRSTTQPSSEAVLATPFRDAVRPVTPRNSTNGPTVAAITTVVTAAATSEAPEAPAIGAAATPPARWRSQLHDEQN